MLNAYWVWDRDVTRYWLANLIQDRGGEEEALAIYGSLYWNPWVQALGYYHRARLHERRGELEQAARFYARFIDLWGDADEHLQPRVEAARSALEMIRGMSIAS
jgi:pyrroloquinoline quinone (PQQ) biosynthesis protein C